MKKGRSYLTVFWLLIVILSWLPVLTMGFFGTIVFLRQAYIFHHLRPWFPIIWLHTVSSCGACKILFLLFACASDLTYSIPQKRKWWLFYLDVVLRTPKPLLQEPLIAALASSLNRYCWLYWIYYCRLNLKSFCKKGTSCKTQIAFL